MAYAQIDEIFRGSTAQRFGKIVSDQPENGRIWPIDKAPEEQLLEGEIYFDPVRPNDCNRNKISSNS